MAWLQDLSKKAETFLNKMDQTAAETLHSPGGPSASEIAEIKRSLSSFSRRSSGSNTPSEIAHGGGRSLPEEDWKNIDESSEYSMRRTASHQEFNPAEPVVHVSEKSERKKRTKKGGDENLDLSSSGQIELEKNKSMKDPPTDQETASRPSDILDTAGIPREAVYRENQLLKSELQGLRKESSMAISRAKRAEKDLEKLINQVATERSKVVSDNTSRESEFMNALKAKDSQVAILRVKIEQLETESAAYREKLGDADLTISKLKREQIEFGSQNVQHESTRRRVLELESALSKEKEIAVYQQNQLAETIKTFEEQNRDLRSTVNLLERNVAAEKSSKEETHKQMSLVLLDCDLARQELVDYQQKAHKILQSKDELIASLKNSNGVVDSETAALEGNEMELEKEMLRTEVINLQSRIETVTKQLHENEILHRKEAALLREKLISAEQRLADESSKRISIETTCRSQSEELRLLQQESIKNEQVFHQRLKEREDELARMRQQFFARSESRPSEEELESRLRMLTENLIQKQTMIETLNTEKNSLAAQTDRLERRLREANKTGSMDSILTMPNYGDSHSRNAQSMFVENQSDNGVAKRIKRAYSTVDRFSFRLGTFLRRYPLARVMVIVYMLLLHFWVLMVLLTYSPEMHDVKDDKILKK